jgi:hypothetical protein
MMTVVVRCAIIHGRRILNSNAIKHSINLQTVKYFSHTSVTMAQRVRWGMLGTVKMILSSVNCF